MTETGHPQNPNQPVKLHPNAFGSEFTLYDKHMAGVEEYDPSQTAQTPVDPADPLLRQSLKLVLDRFLRFEV